MEWRELQLAPVRTDSSTCYTVVTYRGEYQRLRKADNTRRLSQAGDIKAIRFPNVIPFCLPITNNYVEGQAPVKEGPSGGNHASRRLPLTEIFVWSSDEGRKGGATRPSAYATRGQLPKRWLRCRVDRLCRLDIAWAWLARLACRLLPSVQDGHPGIIIMPSCHHATAICLPQIRNKVILSDLSNRTSRIPGTHRAVRTTSMIFQLRFPAPGQSDRLLDGAFCLHLVKGLGARDVGFSRCSVTYRKRGWHPRDQDSSNLSSFITQLKIPTTSALKYYNYGNFLAINT
jgi:hypothetical protein